MAKIPLENPGANTAAIKSGFRSLGGVASGELVGEAAAQVAVLGVIPSALPTGVDDTALLIDFFTRVQGKRGLLPPGTYKITSQIAMAFSGCLIEGVPGRTIITGDFGYALMRLLDCSGVVFRDIKFDNQYVNATEDQGFGVLWSERNTLTDLTFERVEITAPNANTNAVKFNASTTAGGLVHARFYRTIRFIDCNMHDLGRMGIEFLNHHYDGVDRYSDIFVTSCKFKNTGLAGKYGMASSFSGIGSAIHVNTNDIDNPLTIGIEFAGSQRSEAIANTFRNVTRLAPVLDNDGNPASDVNGPIMKPTALIATSDNTGKNAFPSSITLRDNKTDGHQSAASLSLGQINGAVLGGNVLDLGGYVDVIDSTGINDTGSVFRCRGVYGILFRHGAVRVTTDNVFDRTEVDCSLADAGSFIAAIRCEGSGTTRNRIRRGKIKRIAGDRLRNFNHPTFGLAKYNWMEETDYDNVIYSETQLVITMTDAQYQITPEQGQFKTIEFRGALTATRTIFCDSGPDRQYAIRNQTTGGFSLDFRPASGNVGTLVPMGGAAIIGLRNASLDSKLVGNLS